MKAARCFGNESRQFPRLGDSVLGQAERDELSGATHRPRGLRDRAGRRRLRLSLALRPLRGGFLAGANPAADRDHLLILLACGTTIAATHDRVRGLRDTPTPERVHARRQTVEGSVSASCSVHLLRTWRAKLGARGLEQLEELSIALGLAVGGDKGHRALRLALGLICSLIEPACWQPGGRMAW